MVSHSRTAGRSGQQRSAIYLFRAFGPGTRTSAILADAKNEPGAAFLRCLLMLTDRPPSVIKQVFDFCEEVGLPMTLAQIGLGKVTDKQLMDVATAACAPGETIHNAPCEVTPKRVFAAIKAADAEGRARMEKHAYAHA